MDARTAAELEAIDLESFLTPKRPARRKGRPLPAERIRGGQMGTVRAHGKAWRLQYRGVRGPDGRRRQYSVRIGALSEMTEDQAREAALAMIEQHAPRAVVVGATCAWPAWCAHYLAVYVPLLRPGSRQTVTSIIRVHLRPTFQQLQLHEIRVGRISQAIARWVREGAAPATIASRFRVLRRMLRKARSESFQVELPQRGDIDLPRSDATRVRTGTRAFSVDEIGQILAATRMPFRLLFLLCASFGLRISEGLGLRWCDVDLEAARLSIARQYVGGKEAATKTTESVADFAIPAEVLATLRDYRAACPARQVYLFESERTGRPFDDSGVRKRHLRPILARLGLSADRSTHGFRHAFGVETARTGESLIAIARAMRHRDLRSTQVYLDVAGSSGDGVVRTVVSRIHGLAHSVLPPESAESKAKRDIPASDQDLEVASEPVRGDA